MIVTLEGWPDIAKASMRHSSLWGVYFVFMMVLTNFALSNLMVGVIVEKIIHLSLEQENELSAFVAESEQFRSTLQTLFKGADADVNGEISIRELKNLMQEERTREIFSAFGINLNIPPQTLNTIMNLLGKETDTTTFEEFFQSCMRLCGSKLSGHEIFVQYDICE